LSVNQHLTLSDVEIYSLPRALKASINLHEFKCEKKNFAEYLYLMAQEDDRTNLGKVWIFTTHQKSIIGYVTLAMSQLGKQFHKDLGRITSHEYVPGLLIGQMAGHIDYRGRGLGKLMIDWVIGLALNNLSKYVACKLIIVQSDEDKIEMYRHWGFVPIDEFEIRRNTMFRRIA
jgi:predicted GNAT family N-acyltransferase